MGDWRVDGWTMGDGWMEDRWRKGGVGWEGGRMSGGWRK